MEQFPDEQRKRKRTRNRVFDEWGGLANLEAIAAEFEAKERSLKMTFDNNKV